MQINVTNPSQLVSTVAANFGALEGLSIFHCPAGFNVVSGRDANPDPAKGEKLVFTGYGAEFSDYRMGKVLEQISTKPKAPKVNELSDYNLGELLCMTSEIEVVLHRFLHVTPKMSPTVKKVIEQYRAQLIDEQNRRDNL